jgi:hypothetical protein
VDLDFDLDRILASLAPHSDMMAFVLDGRLDPLAEVFGLVHYDSVPAEQVDRFVLSCGTWTSPTPRSDPFEHALPVSSRSRGADRKPCNSGGRTPWSTGFTRAILDWPN